jgi:phage shock protein B
MRALVQLMLVMVIGFIGLLVVVALGGILLAVVIPDLGHSFGYRSGPDQDVIALFIPIIAMVLLFLLAIVVLAMRMAGGGPGRAKSKENADETRLIQELYHGLGRMEQRVEALETLLLERSADPPLFARTAYREALRDKE